MRTLLLSITLLLTLQASDCATAGSIQDSQVTKAKREADASPASTPIPQPTLYLDGGPMFSPKTAQRIRRAVGAGDGWTAEAVKYDEAIEAKYEREMRAWEEDQRKRGLRK